MATLILTPDRNVIAKDYTGEFKPAAERLQQVFAADLRITFVRKIDVSVPHPKRFAQVLKVIDEVEQLSQLDRVVFICHGLKTKLQLGVNLQNLGTFVKALPREPNAVTLYACSAGGDSNTSGDGLFADTLRDIICSSFALSPNVDVVVDAHTTKGQASKNPYVRRFRRQGSPVGGVGGQWIVQPKSELWNPWVRELKGDFRFKFPLMTIGEIHQHLVSTTTGKKRR